MEKLDKSIEEWLFINKKQMIKDIVELVNLKSVSEKSQGVYPFGEEVARALAYTLNLASNMGFKVNNDNNYYGTVTLEGKKLETIGMFGHLDVVPEGKGWAFEPYHAKIYKEYLVGRGVADNKGPTIATLYTMKFLKDNKIDLNHSLMLYLGCAEETGMEDIERFIDNNCMPVFSFTPDVSFSVCHGEKGILEIEVETEINEIDLIELKGGLVSNIVASEAYARIRNKSSEEISTSIDQVQDIILIQEKEDVKIVARGIGKHVAFPEESKNAIKVLLSYLATIELFSGITRKKLQFLSDSLNDVNGVSISIPYQDEISGKLTHTSGIIKKEKDKLIVNFNIRYPIFTPREQMKRELYQYFESNDFKVREIRDSIPNYISKDDEKVKLLNDICNQTLNTHFEPYIMGGGTYARKLSNAIGYGPGRPDEMLPFEGGRGNGHQPDECIKIDNLLDAIKVYIKAIVSLDKVLV